MNYKIKRTLQSIKEKWLFWTVNLIYYYFKIRNIRKQLAYKYIRWNGIEIWWLINPTPVDKKLTKVKYVDYLDEASLKKNYTDLQNTDLQKIDYICKADNLDKIDSASQDFVIGNHLFEHLDNPIKTLIEWHRVLKKWWLVFMAIPDKRRTFDVHRERTTLDHIILDYQDSSEHRDWHHYLEYASIDFTSEWDILKEAKRLKSINYSIHYHVFVEQDIFDIINWCNKQTTAKFEVVYIKHTAKNVADNEFIFILKSL